MINKETESISAILEKWTGQKPVRMVLLPQSGSSRRYFRIYGKQGQAIAAFNPDKEENTAFITFSRHFRGKGLPVPEIYFSDETSGIYLIQDLGDTTLFDLIIKEQNKKNSPEELNRLLRDALEYLAIFQVEGHKDLDYSVAFPRQAFDDRSLAWDLNYFKYYFLKLLNIPFNEEKLENDFIRFRQKLLAAKSDYFMYRDFQSRNIMVHDGRLFFIDYQGGRRGPLQYDVASFLYQARAGFTKEKRQYLMDHYLDFIGDRYGLARDEFMKHFYSFVLIRLLQVLGAYGYRGYYEKKVHFIRSIPPAVENLRELISGRNVVDGLPELGEALRKIIEHFGVSTNNEETEKLIVRIKSFSFMQGIPGDPTGNGGGFVFDCRSLPNPGREERYRAMTGLDQPVILYLQGGKEVENFFSQVLNLVSYSVSNYLQRGFTSLMVSFGCTGGQHRSVYCAERLYRELSKISDIRTEIEHTNL